MNYSKIYKDLVRKSTNSKRTKSSTTYYESHHILPKSLGGSNNKSNLVLLTSREHFVAHKLLTKMYPESWEMKFALFMMAQENTKGAKGLFVSSNTYEKLRKDSVEARKQLALMPNCLEFDNNVKLISCVTSKLNPKWRWKAPIKRAINVAICNGILAYDRDLSVCYKRSKTAYSTKDGKCESVNLLKALDMLTELGYIEHTRSDPDLPAAKRKLSVYKLTEEGYTKFTRAGEKI